MPDYKRPQRKATQYKKYSMVLGPKRELADEDPILKKEQRTVNRVQDYAQGVKPKPRGYNRMEVDPRLADTWFRRAGVPAYAVLLASIEAAMAPGADHRDRMNGVRAAMEIQNRLYGKPVEKLAVAGRVKIEFGGLNPDAFPQRPPASGEAEIIEISGDTGTELPDEGDTPVDSVKNYLPEPEPELREAKRHGVQAARSAIDEAGEAILDAKSPWDTKAPRRDPERQAP